MYQEEFENSWRLKRTFTVQNGHVVLRKFSPGATLEVVILTTLCAVSDEYFAKMTKIPFQNPEFRSVCLVEMGGLTEPNAKFSYFYFPLCWFRFNENYFYQFRFNMYVHIFDIVIELSVTEIFISVIAIQYSDDTKQTMLKHQLLAYPCPIECFRGISGMDFDMSKYFVIHSYQRYFWLQTKKHAGFVYFLYTIGEVMDTSKLALEPPNSAYDPHRHPYSMWNEYRQMSNIRHTKSQTLNVFYLVWLSSSPNQLKPDIKSRMKI